ncbi:MAG TPA: 3,4-dihydroxy-2-butanone-4-phosphate synthase, partial [Rhabdaerophilum sp.]|nr:3,4-dihydroxy-2-butanone-4-phosphate synthase [Rhabdaerophilum sp.]
MKLADWLTRTRTKRVDFAAEIGVTPAAITQLCKESPPWLSRETAERIALATGGAVTPNDFLSK